MRKRRKRRIEVEITSLLQASPHCAGLVIMRLWCQSMAPLSSFPSCVRAPDRSGTNEPSPDLYPTLAVYILATTTLRLQFAHCNRVFLLRWSGARHRSSAFGEIDGRDNSCRVRGIVTSQTTPNTKPSRCFLPLADILRCWGPSITRHAEWRDKLQSDSLHVPFLPFVKGGGYQAILYTRTGHANYIGISDRSTVMTRTRDENIIPLATRHCTILRPTSILFTSH